MLCSQCSPAKMVLKAAVLWPATSHWVRLHNVAFTTTSTTSPESFNHTDAACRLHLKVWQLRRRETWNKGPQSQTGTLSWRGILLMIWYRQFLSGAPAGLLLTAREQSEREIISCQRHECDASNHCSIKLHRAGVEFSLLILYLSYINEYRITCHCQLCEIAHKEWTLINH